MKMNKYVFKDLVINLEAPDLEKLIGRVEVGESVEALSSHGLKCQSRTRVSCDQSRVNQTA